MPGAKGSEGLPLSERVRAFYNDADGGLGLHSRQKLIPLKRREIFNVYGFVDRNVQKGK